MRKLSKYLSFPPLMAFSGQISKQRGQTASLFPQPDPDPDHEGNSPSLPLLGHMSCTKHVGPSPQPSVIPSHGAALASCFHLQFSFLLDESQHLSSSILGLSFSPQSSPGSTSSQAECMEPSLAVSRISPTLPSLPFQWELCFH